MTTIRTEDLDLTKISMGAKAAAPRAADKTTIDQLAASIKASGLLQPILVRTVGGDATGTATFAIVCGRRRLAAVSQLGLKTIRATIATMTDEEAAIAEAVENLQREGLTPLEESNFYADLRKRMAPAEIAARTGRSLSTVIKRLQLQRLSPKVRGAVVDGKISWSAAFLLSRLPDHGEMDRVLTEALRDDANTESQLAEAMAEDFLERYMLDLTNAPFKVTDATLPGGACGPCPKRTGNQRELFDDVKSGDVCTDGGCWAKKARVNGERLIAEANKTGKPVLSQQMALQIFSKYNKGELEHNAPYVLLDGTAADLFPYDSKHWRTGVRELVRLCGKAGEKLVVVLAVDRQSRVRQLLGKNALRAALVKAHLIRPQPSGEPVRKAPSPAARAKAERIVKLKAIRTAAWPKLLAALRGMAARINPVAVLKMTLLELADYGGGMNRDFTAAVRSATTIKQLAVASVLSILDSVGKADLLTEDGDYREDLGQLIRISKVNVGALETAARKTLEAAAAAAAKKKSDLEKRIDKSHGAKARKAG